MTTSHFTLNVAAHTITVHTWIPSKPKVILQISHGMMEHAGLYHKMATALNAHQIAVYCQDHLGHGETAGSINHLGELDDNGWQDLINTQTALTQHINGNHPDLPVFIMGHSMGSFLVQSMLSQAQKLADAYSGVILSGTSFEPLPAVLFGKWVSKLAMTLFGHAVSGRWLNFLVFAPYNWVTKRPHHTNNDWLSEDNSFNNAYENDPYCGFICTTNFFNQLFTGLSQLNRPASLSKIKRTLPILFLTGQDDPLSQKTKKVKKLIQLYKQLGHTAITSHIYPNSRHVVLTQPNFDRVINDILTFIVENTSK